MTKTKIQKACICYFCCEILSVYFLFILQQVNNVPMVALVPPVYDCLMRLSQPDALMNDEEVISGFQSMSGESRLAFLLTFVFIHAAVIRRVTIFFESCLGRGLTFSIISFCRWIAW